MIVGTSSVSRAPSHSPTIGGAMRVIRGCSASAASSTIIATFNIMTAGPVSEHRPPAADYDFDWSRTLTRYGLAATSRLLTCKASHLYAATPSFRAYTAESRVDDRPAGGLARRAAARDYVEAAADAIRHSMPASPKWPPALGRAAGHSQAASKRRRRPGRMAHMMRRAARCRHDGAVAFSHGEAMRRRRRRRRGRNSRDEARRAAAA